MYISVYTFTSEDIGSVIQNKNVILLIEGSPVGGIPDRELLCSLKIPVYLYDGNKRYMHAKYAIKDNSSFFVSSENFGSFSNRGWGVVSDNRQETNKLVKTFFEDLDQSERLMCISNDNNIKELVQSVAKISQLPEFIPGDVIVFTDNCLEHLVSLIRSSDKLRIQQFYFHKNWGNKESPLIAELVGKDVKVLLDGEWYNREKNNETVGYLLSKGINAKIEDTDMKVHLKGMILDNDRVLVSSINWNENSIMRNREVGVVVHGDVSKFVNVFENDWNENQIEQEKNNLLVNIVIFICVVSLGWMLAKRKDQLSLK